MCGIAGILNLIDAPPPGEDQIRRMLSMIRHRGPDQFGLYLGDSVALGSARLSIIDLGGGQQPISNEDQTLWIVFNGEIFNYVELRAELEGKGHRFATHSDTEVILHLFEEYGPDCLTRMNGQWAFAIWDERDRSLFLARDRVGVRPLFYTENSGRLVFGSEIKAIFADPQIPRALDPVGIDQVLTYWSAQAPRTCFEGIQELPPGCFLQVHHGRVEVGRYWEVEFRSSFSDARSPNSDLPPSLESIGAASRSAICESSPTSHLPSPTCQAALIEELDHLLMDAVRIRLRADVPVGAYLSGGLDSSTIAAIVRKLGVSHLDTFSIAFSDPQFDESEHQRRMAQFLGTDHQVVQATHEDIGRVFPEVVWHAETALTRTAPAPMFLLSKLVRQRNYKVVLTGEGADEFLAGYDIFKEAKVRRFWARQPASKWRWRLLQRLYPDIAGLGAAGPATLRSFFGVGLSEVDDPAYSHAIRWRNTARCKRFFSDELKAQFASIPISDLRSPISDLPSALCPLPSDFSSWDPLERAQYQEIQTFLSPYLLSSQGDRMGMANSIEGRFPFLDARVMEFCNRLPPRMKLRGLRDKHLLREMASRLIPPEAFNRPKRPYRAPIQRSFFNRQCEGYVKELLAAPAIDAAGVFRPAAVQQLATKAEQGAAMGETDNMALVGILSTQLLYQQFIERPKVLPAVGEGDDVKVVDRRS